MRCVAGAPCTANFIAIVNYINKGGVDALCKIRQMYENNRASAIVKLLVFFTLIKYYTLYTMDC